VRLADQDILWIGKVCAERGIALEGWMRTMCFLGDELCVFAFRKPKREKSGRAADLQKELEALFSSQNKSPKQGCHFYPGNILRATAGATKYETAVNLMAADEVIE
jgi:hypothetical protein